MTYKDEQITDLIEEARTYTGDKPLVHRLGTALDAANRLTRIAENRYADHIAETRYLIEKVDEITDAADQVIDHYAGTIGTHYEDCWMNHAACFARYVRDVIDGGVKAQALEEMSAIRISGPQFDRAIAEHVASAIDRLADDAKRTLFVALSPLVAAETSQAVAEWLRARATGIREEGDA